MPQRNCGTYVEYEQLMLTSDFEEEPIMTIRDQKPIIAMRKYDEHEFVNARTYWSLTLSGGGDGPTYEMQIRYNAVENERRLFSHDAASRDALELVTAKAYEQRITDILDHESWTRRQAESFLADKVAVMSRDEQETFDQLEAHWDAFQLLFNPAYNF